MRVLLSFDETDLSELPWLKRLRRPRPALAPPVLRDDVRAVARREWEDRTAAEYVGVMIVRRLHGLLVDVNAPADLQELALTMTVQEQQHASLCMAAARSLGSDGEVSFQLADLQQARTDAPPEQQLLEMLATTYMVGEVTAFGLLRHSVNSLPPSGYCDTLREILRDEVSHARIGPAVFAWLKRTPDCSWARYPGDAQVQAWVDRGVTELRGRDVVEPATAALFADEQAAAQLAAVGIPESGAFRQAYLTALRDDVPAALRDAGVPPST